MSYDRISFIPIIQVQTRRYGSIEALDLLRARYLGALKNISAYRSHTVTLAQEGRLDIISEKLLDTPDLWWALAIFNNIVNVIQEITVGKTLRIPSLISIETALGESNTRQVTKTSTLTLQ